MSDKQRNHQEGSIESLRARLEAFLTKHGNDPEILAEMLKAGEEVATRVEGMRFRGQYDERQRMLQKKISSFMTQFGIKERWGKQEPGYSGTPLNEIPFTLKKEDLEILFGEGGLRKQSLGVAQLVPSAVALVQSPDGQLYYVHFNDVGGNLVPVTYEEVSQKRIEDDKAVIAQVRSFRHRIGGTR